MWRSLSGYTNNKTEITVSHFFSSNLLFLPGAPGSLFAVGRVDDFKALQQQILQGGALLREMVVALFALNAQEELNLHKVRQAGRETSTDQKKQS